MLVIIVVGAVGRRGRREILLSKEVVIDIADEVVHRIGGDGDNIFGLQPSKEDALQVTDAGDKIATTNYMQEGTCLSQTSNDCPAGHPPPTRPSAFSNSRSTRNVDQTNRTCRILDDALWESRPSLQELVRATLRQQMCERKWTRTCTYSHCQVNANTHTCMHTYKRSHTQMCIHTCTRKFIHTHTLHYITIHHRTLRYMT